MKWYHAASLAACVFAAGGCKRNSSATPATAAGAAAAPAKRPPLTRADGEKKYNEMGSHVPVRTPFADVVKYFGQEPDRIETRGDEQHAIWVLDDGSELDIDIYKGLSGSSSATFKNKK